MLKYRRKFFLRTVCVSLVLIALSAAANTGLATSRKHAHGTATTMTGGVVEAGDNFLFTTVEADVQVINASGHKIEGFNVTPVTAGDSVISAPTSIPANGSVDVSLLIATRIEMGPHLHGFRLTWQGKAAGKDADEVFIQVKNFGLSILDEPVPTLNLGVVGAGTLSKIRRVELTSRAKADFAVTGLMSVPKDIHATLGKDGRSVLVQVHGGSVWGPHIEFVKVRLNAERQESAAIKISYEVHGDVIPAFSTLELGLVRNGNDHEYLVPVKSINGKPFTGGAIKVEGVIGNATWVSCTPKALDCRLIKFTLSSDVPTGKLNGVLLAELPAQHARLRIPVSGVAVNADTRVISLTDSVREPASAVQAKESATDVSFDAALKRVASAAERKEFAIEPLTPSGDGPLIRWKVEHEKNVHGYNIYRASLKKGPFVQVNRTLIEAKKWDSDAGVQYLWRDTTAVSKHSYWYYVGMVLENGQRQRLTGAVHIVSK